MRIVEEGPARLVLRDRTAWISVVCCAAALLILVFALIRHEPSSLVPTGLFIVFAIGFFRSSSVIFDGATRSCTLKRRDMWRVTDAEVPFDAIRDVVVQPMAGSDTRTVTPCRLSLVTAHGEVPLSSSYEPDLERFEEMRNSVLKSIGGQASASAGAQAVEGLVRAGRRIDAIALLRRTEGLSLEEAMLKVNSTLDRLEEKRP